MARLPGHAGGRDRGTEIPDWDPAFMRYLPHYQDLVATALRTANLMLFRAVSAGICIQILRI